MEHLLLLGLVGGRGLITALLEGEVLVTVLLFSLEGRKD
jgi:hypothetical protein